MDCDIKAKMSCVNHTCALYLFIHNKKDNKYQYTSTVKRTLPLRNGPVRLWMKWRPKGIDVESDRIVDMTERSPDVWLAWVIHHGHSMITVMITSERFTAASSWPQHTSFFSTPGWYSGCYWGTALIEGCGPSWRRRHGSSRCPWQVTPPIGRVGAWQMTGSLTWGVFRGQMASQGKCVLVKF